MDDAALKEHSTWGQGTDLAGFFKAMDAGVNAETAQNIRSVVVEISEHNHGASGPRDNSGSENTA